jgi:hypothetical protein
LVLRWRGRPLFFGGKLVFVGKEQRPPDLNWKFVHALARHPQFLSIRFRRPEVQRALRALEDELGGPVQLERHLREVIFPQAIAGALTSPLRPVKFHRRKKVTDQRGRVHFEPVVERVVDPNGQQRTRKKYDWIKDEHGRRLPPRELPAEWSLKWLCQTARKHAEEAILGLPRPGRASALAGPGTRRSWDAIRDTGTYSPADRTMLRLLHANASHAEVAQALGISTDAARKRASRLALRRKSRRA